jgi:hypothetical protein
VLTEGYAPKCYILYRILGKDPELRAPRVQAGSKTATVDLRVVRGNEKGTQCLGV